MLTLIFFWWDVRELMLTLIFFSGIYCKRTDAHFDIFLLGYKITDVLVHFVDFLDHFRKLMYIHFNIFKRNNSKGFFLDFCICCPITF